MRKGISANKVLAELTRLHQMDVPATGKPGAVNMYLTGLPESEKLAAKAFGMYLHANALYAQAFPSVYALERDFVAQGNALLHAPPGATGSWTSGGNESCMMAVKASRDLNKHIKKPKMLIPITAHPAWWKAAHYLGIHGERIPVHPETLRSDVDAIRAAIDRNTIMVVQSAPNYTFGVIDPIEEVAAICRRKNIWLQVDGCIGGWVLPFAERLGYEVPLWDFRVDGVWAITMDPQKYGYTNKGCSLILYRNRELRLPQFFVHGAWTGYPIANSTVQSSKPGGLLAAAWAVMRLIGDDGYMRLADEAMKATRQLMDGVRKIDGLRLMGNSQSTQVAVGTTKDVDFWAFFDEMRNRGWPMQLALSQPGIPASVHFTIAAQHGPFMKDLQNVMRQAVRAARTRTPLLPAEEVERARALPAESGMDVVAPLLMATMPEGKMSSRTSMLLDALPVPLREKALLAFFEGLTAPAQ